jgi:basic membrane lipoprotein Med (substrate-binding protein (PBP1-ABC) superfamily)
MKKVIAMFAIAALTACGGASTEVKTDSTTVSTDSTTVDASVTTPEVKQDTSYYKELNRKRLKELADSTANIK